VEGLRAFQAQQRFKAGVNAGMLNNAQYTLGVLLLFLVNTVSGFCFIVGFVVAS
jgi:hypothetical protein